jgi:hypothetical protein
MQRGSRKKNQMAVRARDAFAVPDMAYAPQFNLMLHTYPVACIETYYHVRSLVRTETVKGSWPHVRQGTGVKYH